MSNEKSKFEQWCDEVRNMDCIYNLDLLNINDIFQADEYSEYKYDKVATEKGRGRGISSENHNRAVGIARINNLMITNGYEPLQFDENDLYEPDNPSDFEQAYRQAMEDAGYKHFENGLKLNNCDSSYGYSDVIEDLDNKSDFSKGIEELGIQYSANKRNNNNGLQLQHQENFASETDRNEQHGGKNDFRIGKEEINKRKHNGAQSVHIRTELSGSECNCGEASRQLNSSKKKKRKKYKPINLQNESSLVQSECDFKEAIKNLEKKDSTRNDISTDQFDYENNISLDFQRTLKRTIEEMEKNPKNPQKKQDHRTFKNNIIEKSGDPGNFAEALKEVLKDESTEPDKSNSPEREPHYDFELNYTSEEFRNLIRQLDLLNEAENVKSSPIFVSDNTTDISISGTSSTKNILMDTTNDYGELNSNLSESNEESDIIGRFIDDELDYFGLQKKAISKSRSSSCFDIGNVSTASSTYSKSSYVPTCSIDSEEEFSIDSQNFPDLAPKGKRNTDGQYDLSNQSSKKKTKTKQKPVKMNLSDFLKTEDKPTKPDNRNDDIELPRVYNHFAFDMSLEDMNNSNFQCRMNRYDVDQVIPIKSTTSSSIRRGTSMRRGTTKK